MCKIPRTEANFLLGTSQIRRTVGGNLKKRLTTKNIQENEAISNCKIE